MDRRALEFLARRFENYRHTRNGGYDRGEGYGQNNETGEVESRRRRREDGTFMRGAGSGQVEIEYTPQGERNTDNRAYGATRAHKGPDDESRRRIGFGQGEHKSHWSEEEFVGDMEESLYHEVDDIFHYLDIMSKVHRKGYQDLASAFYDIANEKFICAEFLKQQLKKIGSYNPSEHQKLEDDLEEAKKMFKEI